MAQTKPIQLEQREQYGAQVRALIAMIDYLHRETRKSSPLTAYFLALARMNLAEETKWTRDANWRRRPWHRTTSKQV